MISDKVLSLLDKQCELELGAAVLYVNAAARFRDLGLYGFAEWADKESADELSHFRAFSAFTADMGCEYQVVQAKGKEALGELIGVIGVILRGEEEVLKGFGDIIDAARKEQCFLVEGFVLGRLKDQVDAVVEMTALLRKVTKAGGDFGAQLSIDAEFK